MNRALQVKESHRFKMDIFIALTAFLSAHFFLIDDILLVVYVLVIPYFIATRRKRLLYYLAVSTTISFIWMIMSMNYYVNNNNYMQVIGVNLYPLLAWSLGLVGSYVVYSYLKKKWKASGFISDLSLYLGIYWVLLLSVETVGYHFLYIRNAITAIYPGLPVCDCIHAPVWMQAAYFLMGPIFFLVIYMLYKFEKNICDNLRKLDVIKKGALSSWL